MYHRVVLLVGHHVGQDVLDRRHGDLDGLHRRLVALGILALGRLSGGKPTPRGWLNSAMRWIIAFLMLTSFAFSTKVNAAECQAAMPIRIEPGDVWRGPLTISQPDAYLLGFVLNDGAELRGGRHGLVLI